MKGPHDSLGSRREKEWTFHEFVFTGATLSKPLSAFNAASFGELRPFVLLLGIGGSLDAFKQASCGGIVGPRVEAVVVDVYYVKQILRSRHFFRLGSNLSYNDSPSPPSCIAKPTRRNHG